MRRESRIESLATRPQDGCWLASDEAAEGLIRSFYEVLTKGNIEALESILTDDAILDFGPFRFEGIGRIGEWAIELRKMFPHLGFKEGSIKTTVDEATSEFVLRVIGVNGVRGRLQCLAKYSVKNGRIRRVSVKPQKGVLEITFGDVMRLMLI